VSHFAEPIVEQSAHALASRAQHSAGDGTDGTRESMNSDSKALFSEAGSAWQPVPLWATFLIQFGYLWRATSKTRRIALLTMPCDSAAAGLISLGALIGDLCNPNANDEVSHFTDLTRFTQQYTASCRSCKIRCEPSVKGCGYFERASGVVRHKDGHRYRVAETIDDPRCGPAISCVSESETRYLMSAYAKDWRIDGQPAITVDKRAASISGDPYSCIVAGAVPRQENLSKAFSGLCLAGRSRGESSSRDGLATVRFGCDNEQYELADLLTVDGWSTAPVSRICFYNSRTGRFDRYGCAPSLVVADGDSSLLRVLDERRFQNADVIGVLERTLERDRLESIGTRVTELRRWYVEDLDSLRALGTSPRGISMTILNRRVP
jgi:hypothetical protein